MTEAILSVFSLTEIVVDILAFCPLASFAAGASVNSFWSCVSRDEDLWWSILQRQWRLNSKVSFGKIFSDPREIAQTLVHLPQPNAWEPKPSVAQSDHLLLMSSAAQRFLFGIAHGYMPTPDCNFTYHCQGATPIHYRHIVDPNDVHANQTFDGLRLGGHWMWSPDRTAWFATTTTLITSGVFGNGGWQLVDDNRMIVGFLEALPLMPLLRVAFALRRAYGLVTHRPNPLHTAVLEDFRAAIVPHPQMRRPTTSCIASATFTVHLHFLPALQFICQNDGFVISDHTHAQVEDGVVPEFLGFTDALNETHINMPEAEDVDTSLSTYIWAHEKWFWNEMFGGVAAISD